MSTPQVVLYIWTFEQELESVLLLFSAPNKPQRLSPHRGQMLLFCQSDWHLIDMHKVSFEMDPNCTHVDACKEPLGISLNLLG